MSDIKLYTMEEVADIMQVTRRTVYNYVKSGQLHAVKFGKYWKVTEENLKDFFEKGYKAST